MTTKEIPIEGWYLENKTPGHHKQYTILIADDGTVVLQWGRIGTAGQSKIQKVGPEDARDVGLRQLYSKKSGGYQAVVESFKFTLPEKEIAIACENDTGSWLVQQFHAARYSPEYQGDAKAVLKHYDEFVSKAQDLMNNAAERPFEEVAAAFQELKDAWAELDSKHQEATITLGLIEQTMSQRLMSGKL